MSVCDLISGTARLRKATHDLKLKWDETSELWDDQARRDFEEHHLQPIPPKLRLVLAAASELQELLAKAERDCRDDPMTDVAW